MSAIRRLILCLDGTWNNQDSSTNVLHHYSLVSTCTDKPVGGHTVTQLSFYHPGVGTGPLDRVTGGGFGFGLETNIRAAYDWLVQNFQEDDEVFVFGFSRGAHTARSLVGFIGMCGLLRRGAPLTVTQLWENYCLLGRAREQRGGLWSRVFGDGTPSFRRITELLWDPWLEGARSTVPNGVPGQRVADLNPTEDLLVRWSRRIRIKYLGVYDTVGAVGFDALAIPGLRSKLALHHNLRPTTLIQSCRHALAIDEHRSNFQHTPFVAYAGGSASEDERARVASAGTAGEEIEASWSRRIEQRWFVGAHSNIGGGYESNRLAEMPLRWLYDGATRAGLLCQDIPSATLMTPLPVPRDSYEEFASPIWTWVIRAKRNYRVLDPDPELRADRHALDTKGGLKPGFSLVSINEQVDPSVLDYWNGKPNPPANLVKYASRKAADAARDAGEKLRALARTPSPHPWLGDRYLPHLVLLLWATGAAAGVATADRLFRLWQPSPPPLWWLTVVAAAFALIDWGEGVVSFSFAKDRATPARRAFLDSIYWLRALGVALFAWGAVYAPLHLAALGWGAASFTEALARAEAASRHWGLIALSAGVGVMLGNILNRSFAHAPGGRLKPTLLSVVTGPAIVMAAIALVVLAAHALSHTVSLALGVQPSVAAADSVVPRHVRFAGLLLLLQFGVAYFLDAISWVGEPMHDANLGSIVPLQLCSSPGRVTQCLDRWRTILGAPEHRAQAETCMVTVVREALWRDIWGFIPLYTVVLGFGLWYGAYQLRWQWLHDGVLGLPLWFLLPALAAASDDVEDICHLRYLKLHANGRMPAAPLVALSFAMTLVKFVAFYAELVLTLAIILAASYVLVADPAAIGWRGLLALAISGASIVTFVGIAIWALVYPLFRTSTEPA